MPDEIITQEPMTDEEYEEALKNRGQDKLKDHSGYTTFDGTIIVYHNNAFNLGEDFKLGDYVTVEDRQLNIAADLQITGIRKSLTDKGEIVDLIFGEQKLTLYRRVRKSKS